MAKESGDIERAGLIAAVEQAADGVVITDTSGKIQYVNPAFTAMTGYTREEATGQSPNILKSGRHPAAFYEGLWNTIRSGRVWFGEVSNRRKDGTFYTEQMRIAPVRGPSGEVVSYIAIKHDVTEQRAAEDAQAFLAAIVKSSDDAIIAFTPAGIILTWNRGAEVLSGYPAGEAIGKHLSILLAPERVPCLPAFIERILQGNSIPQYESVCLQRDGRGIHVAVTGSPIRNSAGEVAAISVIVRDITERRQAEQDRALLASIVESSDDAIKGVNVDGTLVSWNRGAEKLFGYSSREIIGKSVAILSPPDRSHEASRTLATILKGGTVSPFDTVRQHKDGHRVDISLSVSPIRNPAGEIVGAAAIARDIGKRLLTERRLLESEERFRGVFENAPFGMCASGLDGRFIQVNAAFCRMLGYSEEELLGKTWPELIHPDELDLSLQMKEQLQNGLIESVDVERRYLHRGGSVVWARVKVSLGRDCGRPSYFVVHVEDITERRRTAEALSESEDRFRVMADSCPTLIWVTNAEGGNQFINRAHREFCGTTRDQAEGSKWQAWVHPDDAPEYVRAFEHAVGERAHFRAEARVRRADGQWRWIGSNAAPRFSPGGAFLGHIGLSSDITERRQAEQSMRDSREFAQSTIDALSSHICVLDEAGTIIAVNRAWRLFAESNGGAGSGRTCFGNGANYLTVCDRATGADAVEANEVAAGIRAVLEGKRERYSTEYPCHSPGEQRWFIARVTRFLSHGMPRILVEHINISERRKAEQALRSSEEKFRQLAENIREVFWMMPPSGQTRSSMSAPHMNRFGAGHATAFTGIRWLGRRRSIPTTWNRPMPCLRGKFRENASTRNTVYARPAGRRNGFATGLFPFATKSGN